MKMEKSTCTIVVLSVLALLAMSTNSFARNQVISPSQVAKVHLFLAERGGAIEGYLIFQDKEGNQRAVMGSSLLARMRGGGFEKKFAIDSKDFKYFTIRSGDELYGYIIDPFTVQGSGTIYVYFEWASLKASTTVYID